MNDSLEGLSAHIAIFSDSKNPISIKDTHRFLEATHDHNRRTSELDFEYETVKSNSSIKDRIRAALADVMDGVFHIVPVQNYQTIDGKTDLEGPIIVFEKLRAISAAILYGLSDKMISALERSGILVIPDQEVEIKTLSISSDDASSPAVPSSRSQVKQLNAINANASVGRYKGTPRIGVIDTGIDTTHREFRGKSRSIKFLGLSLNGGGGKSTPGDSHRYHGTQVCSVIAGNNIGVAPQAHLAVAAIMNYEGNGSWNYKQRDFVKAINWLLGGPFDGGSKPHVINLSFGHASMSPALKSHIKKVADRKDIVCVAACSDDSFTTQCLFPAAFKSDWVVSIGGVDENGIPMATSNYDSDSSFSTGNPNFSVLGEDIKCAYPNNQYVSEKGNSFSAAIASAMAGLVALDPSASSRTAVVSLLRGLTIPNTASLQTGAGILKF